MRPLVALLLAVAPAPAAETARRPNVVVILADDLGYEALGCDGGTSYKTPHLDALAASGLRFTRAYATPLCSPSRVELMTGRYGFRTGWTKLIEGPDDYLDPKLLTFGHQLRAAGYKTGVTGKWQLADFSRHPDHPKACGFDEFCLWTWQWKGKKTSRYWSPSAWRDGALVEPGAAAYGPDLFTDYCVDFVRRHKGEPFFLYYPMALVHGPFEKPPGATGGGPDKVRKRDVEKGNTDPDKNPSWYAAMVARMDHDVGRLVAVLDELKLRENTVVIFTGDNGSDRAVASRMGAAVVPGGKGTVTHVGAHVPFLVSWPKTTPTGTVCDDLVDFSDVLPTVCDLTGAAPPAGVALDGKSFAPRVRGGAGPAARSWAFTQLGRRKFVRDGRYLLHEDGRLYDVEADPFEEAPLAAGAGPDADAARKRLEGVLAGLK